jgi:NTP pyrophosphatase (non-canonical NTP hydrolase)
MTDATTTVNELRQAIGRFVNERDWSQFHSPKNLSMAIAIEAAELMEHFQWLSPDEARRSGESPDEMRLIGEELADIFCFALSFANAMNIDVSTALRDKIAKNALKYPADRFRGKFK